MGSFSLVATSKLCSWKSLFIILFCIREWVVYSYDPYMFTVIYLPARMDLPNHEMYSGLVNAEHQRKFASEGTEKISWPDQS